MQMSDFNRIPSRNAESFQSLNKVKLTTNLYEIRLDKLKTTFFKYKFAESYPQEEIQIFRNSKEKSVLFDTISFVSQFKEGFLGIKKVEGNIEVNMEQGKKTKIKFIISDSYALEDLIGEKVYFNILKSLIKPYVKKCIENIGQNYRQDYIGNHKIILMPKFNYNLVELKKKIYLSTNVGLNFREHCTLLTYFQKYDKESMKKLMIGCEVVANYGQKNVYSITDIDYTNGPMSLTTINKKSCDYIQFYKQKYQIALRDLKQPLLKAKNINGKGEEEYLIPELVSLFNTTSPNEFSEKNKEKSLKKREQLPQEKEIYAVKIVKQLGESEVIRISANNFDGIVLPTPAINIDHQSITPTQGIFSFRGKILKAVEIRNWGVVYIEGRDKQTDANDINRLLYHLKGVCPQYGIKISNEPGFIPVTGDVAEWKKSITRDIERFGAPQFLIFLLREEEAIMYPALKHFITQMKVPSQIIKRKTLEGENKKPFSFMAEVLLQIQAKIGGILWQIGSNTELLRKKIMAGGLYLKKCGQGISISFVGSINCSGSQIYSFNKMNNTSYEEINLETLTMYWAKNYVMNNKFPPDTIIIYREIDQSQIENANYSKELDKINSAIKKIGQKTKIANYNPTISYINVNRIHNIQIYLKSQNQQKCLVLENPLCGTVIIEKHEKQASYDFYLNANRSDTNTSQPIKFSAVQNSRMNSDSLIAFTYQQCYHYYNYKGAIDVPGCLQYAYKLGQFSEKTKIQIGYEDKMNRMFYFL